MSENIKQPPELSENAVEQAINAAKKNIAQLSHLKECVLEINMRENYICIDKIDEQNNANQWARIALYDRKGNDCSLMLYDKEWRDCYNGSFRACFEELDCKNVVLDSMPIIDETSKTNETADDIGEVTELSQSDKDAINTSLASDMRKQVEFSKEDTKVIKSVVEDAIAQLPRLKGQKVTVSKKSIFLHKLDEQGNDYKWVQIAVYNNEYTDCELTILRHGTKKLRYAVGSLKECLEHADTAVLGK